MDNHEDIIPTRCRERSAGRRHSWSVFIIGCLLVLSLLPGCSPKVIERVVYQHDTTAVHHRDSIFFRDSIYVKEWLKGDTVYIEKIKDRYIYKDRWRDSVSVREVHDTTTVEVKVEKNLSLAQKAKIGAFPWLVLAVIALLAWAFRKPLMRCLGLK